MCFVDFIIESRTEIFTLAGVLLGAVIGFIGQVIIARMADRESRRKERAQVAKRLYELLADLYSKMVDINSTIGYTNVSKKDLIKYFTPAENAMREFSKYYTYNSVYIPKRAVKRCDSLHTSAINLMLETGKSIRVMSSDIETIPEATHNESFKVRKERWNKGFSKVKEAKDDMSDALREVIEGRLK